MTVNISKPAVNVRSKLAELDKATGIAGEAMLRAETPQEQFNLIGAGRRNYVYNGAMTVWQRGTTGDTIANNGYTADRWSVIHSGLAGNVDYDQETSNTPNEFASALKLSTDAVESSIGAGDYLILKQTFEGQDLQSWQKGTSTCRPVTISFWVRSSVAGTYLVELEDNDNARTNGLNYTIDNADTWEYKTLTFVGDTTDPFANGSGGSLDLFFWLDGGANYSSGTQIEGRWRDTVNNTRLLRSTGWLGSSTRSFYITGVQLELGKVATPFEHRSYGEELALCQRYYTQTNFNVQAYHGASTYASENIHWQQRMRATPTTTLTAGTTTNVTSTIAYDINNNGCRIEILATNNGRSFHIGGFVNADAEL